MLNISTIFRLNLPYVSLSKLLLVEMTRLGELLHSMLFVGRWHLLYSIANAITRRLLLATPKWRRPLWGQSGMVACEETVGLSNFFFMVHILKHPLDGNLVDEPGTSTGPWPRYLIMTSSDEGKTLNTLSPFAIHKGVNGIAGGDVTIKRQFSGDIYLTCSKKSQSDNLLKCVLFGGVPPLLSLNTSK